MQTKPETWWHRWRSTILTTITVVLVAGFFLLPLPEYIEGPGDANDLKQMVTVKGHPDDRSGDFLLMTVALTKARPVSLLKAKLIPYYSVEPEAAVTGGQSSQTYTKVQDFYMQSAINEAKYTAFHAANKPVSRQYLGIYVVDLNDQSPFKGQLHVGDTITQVDGHHYNSAAGFQKYIQHQKIGQKLTIEYQHNGKPKQATEKLMKIQTGTAGIGITLTDNVKVTTKPAVRVNTGAIGGSSGGLMLSLQLYQQLTNKNLRHGKQIAGTGTIDGDGNVGEIGGIDKKVIAAKKAGATVFFAPYQKPSRLLLKYEEHHQTNYQLAKATAKKYAPDMKVVPVKTFSDAVNYLETH
ncbi:peptidase [Levilactobacillus bambusae]|uniref:Peptidase n=2 Tax=Levilactobacillus bambusae TaxID=2024736 RepID=A0A2V1N3P1_9LACO|nr:SepM family pheromone-processing serine protease [Levilactobacillus bambusae]PWG00676.1 peptidase [Levilactobacillus bambusae]